MSLDKPIPNKASTTTSASITLDTTGTPIFSTILNWVLNSSVALSLSPITKIQMLYPKRYNILPIATPSAPLLPMPAITCIVILFFCFLSFLSIKSATLFAALSIKTNDGIPISFIV